MRYAPSSNASSASLVACAVWLAIGLVDVVALFGDAGHPTSKVCPGGTDLRSDIAMRYAPSSNASSASLVACAVWLAIGLVDVVALFGDAGHPTSKVCPGGTDLRSDIAMRYAPSSNASSASIVACAVWLAIGLVDVVALFGDAGHPTSKVCPGGTDLRSDIAMRYAPSSNASSASIVACAVWLAIGLVDVVTLFGDAGHPTPKVCPGGTDLRKGGASLRWVARKCQMLIGVQRESGSCATALQIYTALSARLADSFRKLS